MNSMLIEIIGPSGVGKTTSLKITQKADLTKENWIGTENINVLVPDADMKSFRRAIDSYFQEEFIIKCIEIIISSEMSPSRKLFSIQLFKDTLIRSMHINEIPREKSFIHDELLLHRAFSILPFSNRYEEDADWYFKAAPAPDAVIIFRAHPDLILQRIQKRGVLPNCYHELDLGEIRKAVLRGLHINDIAANALKARGISVTFVEADGEAAQVAETLRAAISSQIASSLDQEHDIKKRLLVASETFRAKAGNYKISTPGLGPVDKVDSQISGGMIQDCFLGGGFGSRRPDGYGMADHRGAVTHRAGEEVPTLAR